MKNFAVKPENYFWLKDGRQIKSLEELSSVLKNISKDVFSHHVNDAKNDFASWINDVFKNKVLAKEIRSKKTPEEIVLCLKRRKKTVKTAKKAIKKVKTEKLRFKKRSKVIHKKIDRIYKKEYPKKEDITSHRCLTMGFSCSIADFLLGILIGILIAVMLSKVI
jgi:F0F1-type ATP synthase assembly protein I